MSRVVFVILCFLSSTVLGGTAPRHKTAAVSNILMARTREWVDTWNKKDVERMRALHADDVSTQLYGIGDGFDTIEGLLKGIRKEKFWNLSWSIRIEEPHVRILGAEAALVAFRLVGDETQADGTTRPFSAAISLIFQRSRGEWKIVHVHDSSGPAPGSPKR